MCDLESLKIDLKGLAGSDACFDYSLGDEYFEAIGVEEVKKGDVKVRLEVHKVTDRYFELSFHIEGRVAVVCDRCLDEMPQEVRADSRLCAKFGEEYSDDDDLVTVSENEGVLDVAWFVYEFIVLNLPVKHVHAPGKCNRAMLDKLEELSATRSSDGQEEAVDPRWSGLEKLKTIIKD